METTFRNTIEDYQAFVEYFVKETKQGKALSTQSFLFRQGLLVMFIGLLGAFYWGATTQWQVGLRVFIILLLIGEAFILIEARFKPIYHKGIRIYKQQQKFKTPTDLQVFQLPKILKIDDDWLEIHSSMVIHRWQWRIVDQIDLTPNFIFIYNWSNVYTIIPKRDFSSEQSFIELGQRIVKLKEKNKDKPIVAE